MARYTNSKFQSKLITLLSLGIVIPVGLSSGYSLYRSNQVLSETIATEMQLQGSMSSKNIHTVFDAIYGDVLYLSKTPPIQGMIRARENKGIDPLDQSTYDSWNGRLSTIFESFIESRNYYDQVRYIDETGQELVRVHNENGQVVTVPANQLQNKSGSDYMAKTLSLKTGGVYISEINLNRENGVIEEPLKPVVRYATPVYSAQGQQRGIVIINVKMDPLFQQAENNITEDTQQQFIVFNRDGYYLYHPDPDKTWGFELNRDERLQNDFSPEIVTSMLSESEGFISQGLDSLISFNEVVPSNLDGAEPFYLMYTTPKEVIYAPMRAMRNVSIGITLATLVIVLSIGIRLLQQVVQSLIQFMGQVSDFSGQLLTTIDDQERMASQQSSSVHETTATIDQLRSSSQQSAQQAGTAALGAQQALKQVQTGQEQVQHTLVEMDSLKQRVGAIATQVQHLNEQANQINTVSSLVSELANQTNMLALNAAVEAVRAGENGKGFAVVAAEIRKLADESQKSGGKIGELVTDIQKSVLATVMVTDQGRRNVEQGVVAAQQTAEAFEDISLAIQQMADSSQMIALNSKQQADAIGQVTIAMGQLNDIAGQSAEGVRQTKLGTTKLEEATTQLRTIV